VKKLYVAALAAGIASSAWAEVILPKVISDKMILQRGVEAPVWGWADQGEEVTVIAWGQVFKNRVWTGI
jgi:sialate O-acetylesterase